MVNLPVSFQIPQVNMIICGGWLNVEQYVLYEISGYL
jgi:hypothetical protein